MKLADFEEWMELIMRSSLAKWNGQYVVQCHERPDIVDRGEGRSANPGSGLQFLAGGNFHARSGPCIRTMP